MVAAPREGTIGPAGAAARTGRVSVERIVCDRAAKNCGANGTLLGSAGGVDCFVGMLGPAGGLLNVGRVLHFGIGLLSAPG
jgi:hypothetical protein